MYGNAPYSTATRAAMSLAKVENPLADGVTLCVHQSDGEVLVITDGVQLQMKLDLFLMQCAIKVSDDIQKETAHS